MAGFSNMQGNVYNGMRWSTAHGYLRPIMDRPNLDVAIQSHVLKVSIGSIQVVKLKLFSRKFDTHPPPRNTNFVELYMLFNFFI